MTLHIPWSKREIKIFTTVSEITCAYTHTVFFASATQNTNLLTWCESRMTSTKLHVSSTKNYSSNSTARGASQFSTT